VQHARAEYNHIQDPSHQIDDNEPVFLIRAQDVYFTRILQYYLALLHADPQHDSRLAEQIKNQHRRGDQWANEHGTKRPDTPTDYTPPTSPATVELRIVQLDEVTVKLKRQYPHYALMYDSGGWDVRVPSKAEPGSALTTVWKSLSGKKDTMYEALLAAVDAGAETHPLLQEDPIYPLPMPEGR
jgi:hypothetical protein